MATLDDSYQDTIQYLEALLRETVGLWDPGWVSFNWRGYTFDHVQRVRGLALTLAERESADKLVVELAALLHDITKPFDGDYVVDQSGARIVDARGYWQNEIREPVRRNVVTDLYERLGLRGTLHNESGAIVARALLVARGAASEICERVATTIRDHLKPRADAPIESLCLYDADCIDANIGLPAFVRNIYINLHFYDRRRAPESPSLDQVLAEGPLRFVQPYVEDNLTRWARGKRADFVPRLFTASARGLSETRLDRLDASFADLAREVHADYDHNASHGRLSILMHYIARRHGDPSIADETASLAAAWQQHDGVTPEARALLARIQREMAGVE